MSRPFKSRKVLRFSSYPSFAGEHPDDDQLLKTLGDGASTNLFLYNVSAFLRPLGNLSVFRHIVIASLLEKMAFLGLLDTEY